MNITDTEKQCVGCGACVDICPTNSLKLVHNSNGFYEPLMANEQCIGCGKCLRFCPALNIDAREAAPNFYYGWNSNNEVRKKSSSGGVFSALAEQILSQGGTVFGAKYSDDFRSVLMSSTDESTLDDLRCSKYCQSYSNGLYKKISKALKKGRKVMVTGTPCQIAATKHLFDNHEDLILVDFICGGVASETAYSDYINYIENKYNSKVKSINMRDKSLGWNNPSIRIEFENGRIYQSLYQFDYYGHYFYNGPLIKNDSCLSCPFTQHNDADITIADFWGYKQANIPKDAKGISLIGVYTEKGRIFLESAKNNLILNSLTPSNAEYAYKEKKFSKELLEERELFLNDVRKNSFVAAAKKHHFKNGKWGILMNIIVRKVVKK